MRKTRYQTKVRDTRHQVKQLSMKVSIDRHLLPRGLSMISKHEQKEGKKLLPVDKKKREEFLTSFLCLQYSFLSWLRNHSFMKSSHHEHPDPPGDQRFMNNWNEATSKKFSFCNCLWFPWKMSLQSFIITMQLPFRNLATWTAKMSGLFPSFEFNQFTLILDFDSGL